MDQILSISRSGDLNKGGNALKSRKLQAEFFTQIERKVESYLKDYPCNSDPPSAQVVAQENILIQLRKLREGLLSTQRADSFAIQVYELSFYLAVSSQSIPQMQSTANVLLDLYRGYRRTDTPRNPKPGPRCSSFATIRLLQSLVETDSLGAQFPNRLCEIRTFCRIDSIVLSKLQELFENIVKSNFMQAMRLMDNTRWNVMPDHLGSDLGETASVLVRRALNRTLENLRHALRSQAWTIIRVAYRQLTVPHDDWCQRVLGFKSEDEVSVWLKDREKLDEVYLKSGSLSTWIVRKPKR